MDTSQNVSAQLYFKQLPADPKAGQFGCSDTGDVLSTCVNDLSTDAQIENAFQKQLDLSEYYKSPSVFNTMKSEYMDKTMEGSNTPLKQETNCNTPPKLVPTPPNIHSGPDIPVGPTFKKSTFGKSTFGSTSNNFLMILALFTVLAVLLYFFYFKK